MAPTTAPTSASRTAPLTLASVDDHLGPAARRFFGAGFRRVGYTVSAVATTVRPDAGFRTTATVSVAYPPDWSRKGTSRDLRPHFSTVDAIVLGTDLSLLGLADARGLDPATAAAAHVRSVRISAAHRPQENLERLRATVTASPTCESPPDGTVLTRTDCRIGTMRVRCEIEHAPGTPAPGTRHHDDPGAVLGPAAQRYHGTGFTRWQQHVRDVRVDHARLHAAATLSVTADQSELVPAPVAPAGITMVDAFVTALQLGQVLLYAHDGVDRTDSDTLWMRQTTLRAAHPDPAHAAGCPAATRLENVELVTMSGERWRTADVVGDMGGVALRCSVAHRLPRRSDPGPPDRLTPPNLRG